jgi:asparagine synthetase B (glutamine-hydrolysing)
VDPDTGAVLCWNGEAWRIHGQAVCQNDTEAVLSLLVAASLKRQDGQHDMSLDPVLEALQDIEGPFSFIYYDKLAKRLYYGRDRLGRRSLLLRNGSSFMLSSVAEALASDWVEVEADGCYAIQLDQAASTNAFTPIRYPWNPDNAMVGTWHIVFLPRSAIPLLLTNNFFRYQALAILIHPFPQNHASYLGNLGPSASFVNS